MKTHAPLHCLGGHLGLCMVIAAALTLPALAQETEPETFTDSVDVTVINLEAVVTDKDGNLVTGLSPEDFVLVVDGQEVPIDYFSEIRDRKPIEPRAPASPSSAAPSTGEPAAPPPETAPQALPSVATEGPVGTHYLVFVDNYFAIPRDRDLVLERVAKQLGALGTGDRVAIVAFDGRELELVSDWTDSPAQIGERVQQAASARGLGAQRLGEQNLFDLQQRNLNRGLIDDGDTAVVEERIRQLSEQVRTMLRAATATLRAVSRPTGRKVMLMLSGGWPRDPALYVAGLNANVRHRTLRFAPEAAFEELITTANLLGYTLYPVDVPGRQISGAGGLRTAAEGGEHIPDLNLNDPLIRANQAQQPQPPPRDAPAPAPTSIANAERFLAESEIELNNAGREKEVEASLLTLAEQTGGLAFLNGDRQQAFERAVRDTGSFYWLGFSPQRRHDDQVHSVRVEVKNPGLEVRSRSSFKDLSRSTEAALVTEGQLLFSSAVADATLGIELGEPVRAGRQTQLPVALRIPLDEVVMLPGQGGYQAQLELRVAALDERGRRSEMPVIPVRFGGPTAPPPGAHATYDTTLEVRSAPKQRLVLSLHDLVGGKVLTATVDLDPG